MGILRALAILIEHPALALVPALVFGMIFVVTGRRVALMAGLLWLGYGLYEYGMTRRILCSGECNIRIDLLLVYPVLILVSLASLVTLVVRAPARRR